MKDFKYSVRFLITKLWTTKLLIMMSFFILSTCRTMSASAQAADPVASIKDLKEGYLIVRFPAYRAKIDTLTAMVARSTDEKNKKRLEDQLQEAIEERDTLLADYIDAFKNAYHFSKVAYFFDYDGRDLNTANYYNLDGDRIAVGDLSEVPLFYLYFESTEIDPQDALVVYNRYIKKIPAPFPNDFILGGINVLFLKLSGKKYPTWRVSKMDKKFLKFYAEVK
jgi:hypothetical protein